MPFHSSLGASGPSAASSSVFALPRRVPPVVGRIEAYVIWTREKRAGFQFERIIRLDDFVAIIDTLQPNPRLRRNR